MAEFLVRARNHWLDAVPQDQIATFSQGQLDAYNARFAKGDIILVRPDGWTWGKEECLPNFIVIKVPNIVIEDVRHLESQWRENGTLKKKRRFHVPDAIVDTVVSEGGEKTYTLSAQVVNAIKDKLSGN
jgi:hypothetical protein